MALATHSALAYTLDVLSAGAILGTIVGVLPYFAAVAGLIWYCIQIWESKTFMHLRAKWRHRRTPNAGD